LVKLWAIAYSGRFRPPIPGEAGHPFRLIPATDSGRSRPPIPEHSGHPLIKISQLIVALVKI
jgi:hypothetical protein